MKILHVLVVTCLVFLVGAKAPSVAEEFSWEALLDGKLHWGFPPAGDDIAYPYEVLPELAGWFRFLGRSNIHAVPLLVADGLLIVKNGNNMLGLELDTGEEVWRSRCDPYLMQDECTYVDGVLLIRESDGITAVRTTDGLMLWQLPELQLLGTSKDYVWAGAYTGDVRRTFTSIDLLDPHTGEVVSSADLSADCRPFGGVSKQHHENYAMHTPLGVYVLGADGSTIYLPYSKPDWAEQNGEISRVDVGLTDKYIVVGEPRPWELSRAENAGSMEGDAGNLAEPEFILSCYALPSGELLWRRSDLPKSSPHFSDVFYYCTDESVVLLPRYSENTLILADGEKQFHWGNEEVHIEKYASSWIVPGADGKVYLGGSSDQTGQWLQLDLTNDLPPQIVQTNLLLGRPEFYSDGWLVCNPGQFTWGGGRHLNAIMALQSTPDGSLIAGKLAMDPPPVSYAELRKRFLATDEPLQNVALMQDLVAAGINSMLDILPHTTSAQPGQFDALLAFAIYLDKYPNHAPGMYRNFVQNQFFEEIIHRRDPELTPIILDWLKTIGRDNLPDEAQVALAYNGGTEAREYLCKMYAEMELTKRADIPSPYALIPIPPDTTEAPEENPLPQWVEYRQPGGGRYLLFPSPGLLTERDLYLAVDGDNDGLWDEVLPTGLQDIYFVRSRFGYRKELNGTPVPLGLVVKDGLVSITYNQPASEPIPVVEGLIYREYDQPEVHSATADLPLDFLKADTDGDGLTDITEKMMYTDPLDEDTDGDGLSDLQDLTPKANGSEMGRIERGIARAMSFYFSKQYYDTGWWQPDHNGSVKRSVEGQPWNTRYFLTWGSGPVAFSGDNSMFGICLTELDPQQEFKQAVMGFLDDEFLRISWEVREMTAQESFAASSLSKLMSLADYEDQYGEWEDDYSIFDYDSYEGADMAVSIDHLMNGERVLLIDVDGEFIPVGWGGSWIAD